MNRSLVSACFMLAALCACDPEESEDSADGGAEQAEDERAGDEAGDTGGPVRDAGSTPAERDAGGSQTSDAGTGSSTDAGAAQPTGDAPSIGKKYEGGEFHLGPVDWEETKWHNACAPAAGYAAPIRALEGTLLAGLWGGIPNVANYCDACIAVTTAKGKSAVLRVVTYGDTTPNSIDVSPDAMKLLDSGEYPRSMTWSFTKCPDTGKVMYEFQTGSSEWWTSLWVRNARLPLAKVEVKSVNHASFTALERGGDGTLTDGKGFGQGEFTLRLTSIDGKEYVDTFAWPSGGIAGKTLAGQGNFP